jgi:hypothetical protein
MQHQKETLSAFGRNIGVRLTIKEIDELERKAQESCLSVSNYLRLIIAEGKTYKTVVR